MRPIPKSLLKDSATHKYGTLTKDEWGNATFKSSETISCVNFQSTTKIVLSKDNKEIQLAAVMYFDCRNSTPLTASFAVEDVIQQTDGPEYRIKAISVEKDHGKFHHLEIGLA